MGHIFCPISLVEVGRLKIKALVSFAGKVTMAPGEIREVPNEIAEDLIRAGYAEKVTTAKKSGVKNESK